MQQRKFGDLTVRLAGGTDREGGGDGPLCVLLHGFGAPGGDLVPLFRALTVPREVRFAFPAAPLVLDPSAPAEHAPRAWWMIDMLRLQSSIRDEPEKLARQTPAGLDAARSAIEGMLDAFERELNAPREQIVLGGFSQGAMLACDVTLRSARPPAGLVLLSGAPICADDWQQLAPARKGLRVLQSHGRSDPVLPFHGGEWLRDFLQAAGLSVEWVPFGGGHGIPDGVLDRLGAFLGPR
jgi:phospholipase/carboxylesterase